MKRGGGVGTLAPIAWFNDETDATGYVEYLAAIGRAAKVRLEHCRIEECE